MADNGDNSDKRGLEALVEAARATGEKRGAPPVERWDPPSCGDIDILIRRDGVWLHEGSPIGRPELVRLFASILRKDGDDYWLVTPVEKLRIRVEDLPLRAVRVDVISDALVFTTDMQDEVAAGPDHVLRVETDPKTGEPAPSIHVRGRLEARITRPVFYELVALAEPVTTPEGDKLVVRSNGVAFPLGRVDGPWL